ncbi:MAG: hypothetical protein ACK54F_12115 [Planctomycetia bacterium]|jgi:hypothetical protein
MRATEWSRLAIVAAAVVMAAGSTGCKSLNERYIALEVWKYEKCFGHLPPGFVPPGAAVAPAAPAMRPCGQPSNCCESTPCQTASFAPGGHVAGGSNCNDCQGAVVEGGMPAGGTVVPSLPAGPGGAPGPMPGGAPVTTSKPVVISDEVVLP